MNWTKLAESRIEEAIANGEFDDLPGQGQPLDLAEYFAQPAAERAGAALLKNANVIPPEVQLLKEIAELEEAILEVEAAECSAGKNREAEAAECPNGKNGKVGAAEGSDGKNRRDGNHKSHPSHSSYSSYSSHGDHLRGLREQLQQKRVAFALAMERRRRRDPRPIE